MKKYYIGFNANNAICNEKFFDGSITLYPTKEKGNIYFSNTYIANINDRMDEYKNFVIDNVRRLQKENKGNIEFLLFNKKAKKLCEDISDINFISNNDESLIDLLNDKFKVRNLVKPYVPILDYHWINGVDFSYDNLKKEINCKDFVVQASEGAGGNTTFFIDENNSNEIQIYKDSIYCFSEYKKHIPLNTTLIIGEYDVIILPTSIQLIKVTDNKFKYVGGDFIASQTIKKDVLTKINSYNKKIGNIVKKIGYRGILGIDYILCENDAVYFMEINPRFQSSSFLISQYLEKEFDISIAELHYSAIKHQRIKKFKFDKIDKCFLNCNRDQEFKEVVESDLVYNGYFQDNPTSFYRKIYNNSIYDQEWFEKL